jgi:hypothetical protein
MQLIEPQLMHSHFDLGYSKPHDSGIDHPDITAWQRVIAQSQTGTA